MKKILLMALLVMSAGTAAMAQGTSEYFVEKNSGQILKVAVDSTIEIRLAENPDTGFMWIVNVLNTKYFRLISDVYNPTEGVRIFRLKPLRIITPGNWDLEIVYRRPWLWEKDNRPEKTFLSSFNVVQS